MSETDRFFPRGSFIRMHNDIRQCAKLSGIERIFLGWLVSNTEGYRFTNTEAAKSNGTTLKHIREMIAIFSYHGLITRNLIKDREFETVVHYDRIFEFVLSDEKVNRVAGKASKPDRQVNLWFSEAIGHVNLRFSRCEPKVHWGCTLGSPKIDVLYRRINKLNKDKYAREALPSLSVKSTKSKSDQYQNSTGTSESDQGQNNPSAFQLKQQTDKDLEEIPAKKEVKSKPREKPKFPLWEADHPYSEVFTLLCDLKRYRKIFDLKKDASKMTEYMARYNLNLPQLAYVIQSFKDHWEDDESKLDKPRARLTTFMRNAWTYNEKALQNLNTQSYQGDFI